MIAAVLLLPAIVLGIFHWDLPSLGAYHDDAIYVVTARAVANGAGYRLESLPDERWQTKVFPKNTTGFLLIAWLSLPVLLWLQMRMLAKLELGLMAQVVACLAILAYPRALLLSVAALSDLWFCCAALLAVRLAEQASRPGAHWMDSAVAGLAAALAYLTKSAGIVLVASAAGVMARKAAGAIRSSSAWQPHLW